MVASDSLIFQGAAGDLQDRLLAWFSWLRDERRVSPNTLSSYRFDLSNFISFLQGYRGGEIRLSILSALTLTDFRAWLAHNATEGLAASSRARSMASVRNFFHWLDRSGVLHNEAVFLVRNPKIPKRLPRPVSETAAQDIIALAKNDFREEWIGLRDEALFTLLYGAGLRIGEALSLRCVDMDGDSVLVTGKGNKQRRVPLLPIVKETVKRYVALCPHALGARSPLFVGSRGDVLNAGVAQRDLRRLRRELNLPETVTPHALRHSFATHLLVSGADIRSLQELLGHASLSTTQLYTKVDSNQLAEAYRSAHPRARKR